jgi:hypothetical protein
MPSPDRLDVRFSRLATGFLGFALIAVAPARFSLLSTGKGAPRIHCLMSGCSDETSYRPVECGGLHQLHHIRGWLSLSLSSIVKGFDAQQTGLC